MKQRLDALLVEKGFFETREKAKASVMAGLVLVNGQQAGKPGDMVQQEAILQVKGNAIPYVSRGGLKLEKAIHTFQINPTGWVCLDIGASTGGFTDCMLQNGAVKVYAVDVGYGQLAWSLRTNPSVVVLERTNFRYVTAQQIPEPIDFATADVAFISLRLILPAAKPLMRKGGQLVCLIKPQFEAGRDKVGKKGVVRDPVIHREVIHEIIRFAEKQGFLVLGLTFSPIRGPEGNIEYLLWLQVPDADEGCQLNQDWTEMIDSTVSAAHLGFDPNAESIPARIGE